MDVVYGTMRGVTANNEQRAAIEEYITALESANPNDATTDVSVWGGASSVCVSAMLHELGIG